MRMPRHACDDDNEGMNDFSSVREACFEMEKLFVIVYVSSVFSLIIARH
jgi:hypothetical protein